MQSLIKHIDVDGNSKINDKFDKVIIFDKMWYVQHN